VKYSKETPTVLHLQASSLGIKMLMLPLTVPWEPNPFFLPLRRYVTTPKGVMFRPFVSVQSTNPKSFTHKLTRAPMRSCPDPFNPKALRRQSRLWRESDNKTSGKMVSRVPVQEDLAGMLFARTDLRRRKVCVESDNRVDVVEVMLCLDHDVLLCRSKCVLGHHCHLLFRTCLIIRVDQPG